MGARLRKTGLILGTLLLVLYVGANIISSQTLPSLYYRLINGDKQAAISYLTHIRPLTFFQSELIKYKNIHGLWVEEQVFKKEWERNRKIAALEDSLEKNRKSRDILYGLSVLYDERGDKARARDYLEKAREIDPDVK